MVSSSCDAVPGLSTALVGKVALILHYVNVNVNLEKPFLLIGVRYPALP